MLGCWGGGGGGVIIVGGSVPYLSLWERASHNLAPPFTLVIYHLTQLAAWDTQCGLLPVIWREQAMG